MSIHIRSIWARLYSQSPSPHEAHLPGTDRATNDTAAAWARWHDPDQLARVPVGAEAWYLALEQARVEHLASADLPGIATNLRYPEYTTPAAPGPQTLHLAARAILASKILPANWQAAWPARPKQLHGLKRWLMRSAATDLRAEIIAALTTARDNLNSASDYLVHLLPVLHALAKHWPIHPNTQVALPAQPAQAKQGTPQQGNHASDAAEINLETKSSGGIAPTESSHPSYVAKNRHLDEVVSARRLLQPEDALALAQLQALPQARLHQLALRLQRRLQAARPRRWNFEQDSGLLDHRRLARLFAPEAAYDIFRTEDDQPIAEACVTLLVDQSGSMRGRPQALTALAIDAAVRVLEHCRITTEVLGYTTTHNANNPLSHAWQAAGSPPGPGRLNGLRHIIYQRAGQPWRAARPSLGVLLRQGFGNENIDGEALDWAARRLLSRPEPRRILLVLADGAPFDAATAAANGRGYLSAHLREVITALEAPDSRIHLVAIGSGSAITRYYQRALVIQHEADVAGHLFEQLEELLL